MASAALLTALAFPWPARAEPIFLHCTGNLFGREAYADNTIDLTNNTVNGVPAQISQTTIDWQTSSVNPLGQTTHNRFHIDRRSGDYTDISSVDAPGAQPFTMNLNCQVGSPPPTKF
jgi:hypothetical protein